MAKFLQERSKAKYPKTDKVAAIKAGESNLPKPTDKKDALKKKKFLPSRANA